MGLVRTAAPVEDLASLGFLKAHLRLDTEDADEYLLLLLQAARERLEEELGRSLLTQTWTWTADAWPSPQVVKLARGPVQSVTSLAARDDAGAWATINAADYRVDLTAFIPTVTPVAGVTWPSAQGDYPDQVKVVYVAGYGAEAALPAPIRHATMILVAHLWEHPELVTPGNAAPIPWSVDALVAPYRILEVA